MKTLPRLIAFDFDGTLCNDIKLCYRATCKVFSEHHMVAPNFDDYVRDFREPESFYGSRGITFPMEQVRVIFNEAFAAEQGSAELFCDVSPVLRQLALCGVSLGVVSAQRQDFIDRQLTQSDIVRHLKFVLGEQKDKTACLKKIKTDYGFSDKRDGWYVGDFVSDIVAAREAEFLAVGITRGFSTAEALLASGADRYIADLWDLLKLVALIGGGPVAV